MKNKLVALITALIASTCLWVYVVTVVTPEEPKTISNIPVVFSGIEDLRDGQNLLITKGADQTVSLKVYGKRSVCNKLNAGNITVSVDVSRIKKVGVYNMSYDIKFPADLEDQEISIMNRSPSSLSFTVGTLATKAVEVKGVFDGDVADGYMAGTMTFNYDEIEIKGPAEAVNRVSYAQVILTRSGVSSSVTDTLPYTLIDADGNPVPTDEISADVSEIEVTLPVIQYKEVPLAVDVSPGGGAAAANAEITIEPSTVTVSGDAAALNQLTEIKLGTVDLSAIEGSTTLTMPIQLANGLSNVSGDEEAKVSVRIKGLDTKQVRASDMAFTGVPAGYAAVSMTQMLQVKVRAPNSEIGKITADNLRVVADLSEIKQAGSYTVPVSIVITGFKDAGVIGNYTIVVSLTAQSE